jgi:hypothetical protein
MAAPKVSIDGPTAPVADMDIDMDLDLGPEPEPEPEPIQMVCVYLALICFFCPLTCVQY